MIKYLKSGFKIQEIIKIIIKSLKLNIFKFYKYIVIAFIINDMCIA